METIKYLRRKNLGNYEHEELEITAAIQDGQSRSHAVADLRNFVIGALNGQLEAVNTTAKVEAPKKEIEAKGEVKVAKPKPQEAKKEEVKTEVKKETVAEEKVEEKTVAEAKVEEKKEEKKEVVEAKAEVKKEEVKKPAAKKETTLKIKPSKNTMYDRLHDPHKALLGKFLDGEFPNWRQPETLKKAGTASRALHGTEFQDGEGEILESFKEAFRPYMA